MVEEHQASRFTEENVESGSNSNDLQEIRATRGSLKVEVSTSESIVNASSEFSIFVIIMNPYDVPITIYSVLTHIPIELMDVLAEQREKNTIAEYRELQISNIQSRVKRVLKRIGFFIDDLFGIFKRKYGERIAEAVSTSSTALRSESSIFGPSNIEVGNITDSAAIAIGTRSEAWHLVFPDNLTSDELDMIFSRVEDYRSGKLPVILQPGDTHVKQFVLRTTRKLLFTPIEYLFQMQIKYSVDNMEHLNVVPFRLTIRAALTSIMTGSIIGGLLGAVARILSTGEAFSIGTLTLSTILSAIAVVAFARKTSAQQIISIEDFWGGIFIGFLVGYLGEGFFRSLIGQ